jgi:hypothetical protein
LLEKPSADVRRGENHDTRKEMTAMKIPDLGQCSGIARTGTSGHEEKARRTLKIEQED